MTFHIPSHPTIYIPLYLRFKESFQRKFLREKPQRKTRLIHSQSSLRNSSNSSTLFLSIVKSLRGLLSKHFLTISISLRELFGALGSNQEGINFTLVDAMVKQRNSRSQKRNRFSATLLEQEVWRVQVHWVDQAWRIYYCSCIPITFSSGLLTAWRVAKRFYVEGFGFLFDNTSCVVLVFASLFP